MPDYHIGLSGLEVAQRALEIIGTNIANASTDGYHRQEACISPLGGSTQAMVSSGGAVLTEVRRNIDMLLENQIQLQRPQLGQINQEVATLTSVESALGNLGESGLGQAISNFFDQLSQLTSQPTSQAYQEQVVMAADAMARSFASVGSFLNDLCAQLRLEADSLVGQANLLSIQIAQMNTDIRGIASGGGSPNLLMDKRDQAITELADLVDVQTNTIKSSDGMTQVSAWGIPLVTGGTSVELETSLDDSGMLAVAAKGSPSQITEASGGKIGGLINLYNNILPDVMNRLDGLVRQITFGINSLHVQGISSAGSFSELQGAIVSSSKLSEWSGWGTFLQAGQFHIRLSDSQTGSTTSLSVDVTGDDTAVTIAAKINALTGLSANMSGGMLHVASEDPSRYRFDFLPAPTTTLSAGWTGTSQPAVEGIYSGSSNRTWTCTVVGGGSIGLTDGLAIEVKDGDSLVTTLHPGLGYAAGDRLTIADGLSLTLTAGTLTSGQTFTLEARSNSDPTGFLAAAGMNTFFQGDSLSTIAVNADLLDYPSRLAVSLNGDQADNTNLRRMAALADTPQSALNGLTPTESFHMAVTSVGQRISFARSRQTAIQDITQQLNTQRDLTSGVDVNEEAAKMIMFEKLFQSMSKFISVQERAHQALMDIL